MGSQLGWWDVSCIICAVGTIPSKCGFQRVSLHSTERAHGVVGNVSVNGCNPAAALWEGVVEFGCECSHYRQAAPWDVRKIMVYPTLYNTQFIIP